MCVKQIASLFILVNVLFVSIVQAEDTVLKPVDMSKKNLGLVIPIPKGADEVDVNSNLIRRIGIGWGKSQITISLKNKTIKDINPQFRIDVYNKYGMIIDSCRVAWFSDLKAGDSYTEIESVNLRFGKDFHAIFKHSTLKLPDDVNDAAYFVIVDK